MIVDVRISISGSFPHDLLDDKSSVFRLFTTRIMPRAGIESDDDVAALFGFDRLEHRVNRSACPCTFGHRYHHDQRGPAG